MQNRLIPKNCPVCGRFLTRDDYVAFYYLDCSAQINTHFSAHINVVKNKRMVDFYCFTMTSARIAITITAAFYKGILFIDDILSAKTIIQIPIPDWDFDDYKELCKKVELLMAFT